MINSVADLADGEVAAIATTTPTVFVPAVVVSMPKNLEQNLPQRSAAARGDLSSLDDSAAVENVLSCWTEVCEQCWLSGPTILMLLLQYLTGLTVVTFVGRLGASYLAAMSMATSFVGIVGFDVLTGLSSGLETLCGQAYGAKQYHLLGIYLQRAIFVLLVVAIPICLASFYMAPILIAFGENPAIANNAQVYGRCLLPCILAFAVMMPFVKFCQSQRIVVPLMWCAAAACLLQFPLCLLLITKLNWGYQGGAVAISLSTILDTVILVTILRFSPKCKKSFTSLSLEALHDLRGFFKLAVPSALMMCLELWMFQILTLLAGLLPNTEIEMAAFVIGLSLFALSRMISVGLSVGSSVRVSNELGAGQPHAARFAAVVSMVMVIVVGLVMAIIVLFLRNVWGSAFSTEQEVLDRVSRSAPYLAALGFVYCCQQVLSGVVRGIGWQKWGVYANLGAYYGIGLPTAVILVCMFQFDGRGLWIGMLAGVVAQTVALTIITRNAHWENLSKEALNRVFTSESSFLSTTVPLLDDK
ncbi:unnamed protein product, partial [Sphagnum troendelagicum]